MKLLRELASESHTLLLLNEEGLGLQSDVFLKADLAPQESLKGRLALHQLPFKALDGVTDLLHLSHQTVLDRISHQLLAGTVRAYLQSSLCQHHGATLLLDAGYQLGNVVIHQLHLLENL